MRYSMMLATLLLLTTATLQAEELVMVQMVSKNQKSFIVRRGNLQGIALGQKSVFSSPTFSLAAKSIEVNREYSLWTPIAKVATVPFSKGEMITYSQSLSAIWSQVAKYNSQLKERQRFRESDRQNFSVASFYDEGQLKHPLSIRGALSMSLRETNSYVAPDEITARQGFQLDLAYKFSINDIISWAIGIRYDYESMAIQTPSVTGIYSRYLIGGDLLFNLYSWGHRKRKLYGGIGAAIGLSSSNINQEVASGSAVVLPIVRLGLEAPAADKSYSLIVEWITEAIADRLLDENDQVLSTNIISSKIAIGTRW
jgi:hypothetical protein